jgi:SAM-dependent methyltransferase
MEDEVFRHMAKVEDTHWWYRARRHLVGQCLERLSLPPCCRILEIGAGTGGNFSLLKRFGRVSAMEPSSEARDLAAELRGLRPLRGALPYEVPFGDEQFDLICMFDVLEHVEDDLEALRMVGRHLAPGGYLVLTVPAYRWLWSHHDEILHHKRRYTRRALTELTRQAGLLVVRSTYFNSLILPVVVVTRLGKKLFGLRYQEDAMPPAFANRLFYLALAGENHLVQLLDLPAGVSILLIAGTPAGT